MNNYKHLKNVLNDNIKKLNEVRSLFCENAEVDFTRNRKLDFETTIKNVICIETGSLKNELYKMNDYAVGTPTVSAFVQARNKIKVDGGLLGVFVIFAFLNAAWVWFATGRMLFIYTDDIKSPIVRYGEVSQVLSLVSLSIYVSAYTSRKIFIILASFSIFLLILSLILFDIFGAFKFNSP